MENRPPICSICRQRFSAPTNATTSYKCPACQRKIQISGNEPSRTQDLGQIFRIGSLGDKLKKKTLVLERPKCPSTSLNCNPSALESSSTERPRKRALLCGVTYRKWNKYKLKGTINDVKNIRGLLIDKFGFRAENILVLTDEEPDPKLTPTRKNILNALEWLVKDCQSGDSLVFYFSGHGLRKIDLNDNELDGFDETICPVDFKNEGMILDSDINSTIVWPITEGVTLHAIVDACHSGTILDLLFVYDKEKKEWKYNNPQSGAHKKTSGGLAICVSACEDDQEAAETSEFTGKTMNGAMTYFLIEAIKNNPTITYGHLLDIIYDKIEEPKQEGRLTIAKLLKRVSFQKPQLSSSKTFDVYRKEFKL